MKHLTEVRARHEAWKVADAIQEAKFEKQVEQFRKAEKLVFDSIKDKIRLAFSNIDLPLSILVDRFCEKLVVNVEIQRGANETMSLIWHWSVSLDSSGKLEKKTNSWSGLEATTQEQIDSLRKSVDALEILVGIDWLSILDMGSLPCWEDYVTEKHTIGDEPNFSREEKEAVIKDIVGTEQLVLVNVGGEIGKSWVRIIKDTGKQYQVGFIPAQYIKEGAIAPALTAKTANDLWTYAYPSRISHDKLISGILYPLQIMQAP